MMRHGAFCVKQFFMDFFFFNGENQNTNKKTTAKTTKKICPDLIIGFTL